MLFYDLLSTGQPNARSCNPLYNIRASMKPKKNMIEICGRNPEATVLHLNNGPHPSVIVFGGQCNTNITTGRTELNRVCEQVGQGSFDA